VPLGPWSVMAPPWAGPACCHIPAGRRRHASSRGSVKQRSRLDRVQTKCAPSDRTRVAKISWRIPLRPIAIWGVDLPSGGRRASHDSPTPRSDLVRPIWIGRHRSAHPPSREKFQIDPLVFFKRTRRPLRDTSESKACLWNSPCLP
jgi:hypothetical protein